MHYLYESEENHMGFPIKEFIHSISQFETHWHKEIEILMVLKGSINMRVGNEQYTLKENDLILINSNEIHNTYKTEEDNVLLAIQINTDCYAQCYANLNRIYIDCKSFQCKKEEQEKFNRIRQRLAKIVWELNKKRKGYQLLIGSEIHLLLADLISNFNCTLLEDNTLLCFNKETQRLQNIIRYINENIEGGITLQDVADNQKISIYYLSHFFKQYMGFSFQEYINYIRLDKAVILLTNTEQKITEIAYSSGFPSTKALNTCFKEAYNCTPTEYRQKYRNTPNNKKGKMEELRSRTYLDVDRNMALHLLFQYLEIPENNSKDNNQTHKLNEIIEMNVENQLKELIPFWKKLTCFGRASDALREEFRNQFRELQKDIGFEYVRFHGIFCDDMLIINFDDNGKLIYNWYYVDKLFDFFKEINIRPFVELGFMPSEFGKSDITVFAWKANITLPKDISLWTNLVKEFVKHCVNRYGLAEVETWYFEVWNEPDLENVFWIGDKESYYEFFKETAMAVKSISPNLRIGGPSITYQTMIENNWLDEFFKYTITHQVPLDFVSFHIYSESYSSKKYAQDLWVRARKGENFLSLLNSWNEFKRIYHDKDHTYNTIISANQKINESFQEKPELHITEWNASSYGRNLINDTCFIATFIIYNILRANGKTDSLGFWTFTDIIEELKLGISSFHGGFGLINKDGIKKPSYYAYYFLSKLGQNIIDEGEDYIVTKEQDNIQILLYNFSYFDDLFIMGDTSLLTNEARYLSFEEKPGKNVNLQINGLSGNYKQICYELNRENGSAVDEWIKMGAPEHMDKDEIKYLKGKAYPKVSIEMKELKNSYTQTIHIPVHGIALIILEKLI
jgi:xylan 1,4-beta-xylosidase